MWMMMWGLVHAGNVCDDPEKAAEQYGLDTREILIELGKRRMVGGQEDMIVDVALDLVSARAA